MVRLPLLQPQKVSAEELEVALAEREKPLIVDFYATWCGPCVLLAKELELVRPKSSRARVGRKSPPTTKLCKPARW